MFMNCFGWQPHCVLRGDSIRLFYEPFHLEESRAERKSNRLDKAGVGRIVLYEEDEEWWEGSLSAGAGLRV